MALRGCCKRFLHTDAQFVVVGGSEGDFTVLGLRLQSAGRHTGIPICGNSTRSLGQPRELTVSEYLSYDSFFFFSSFPVVFCTILKVCVTIMGKLVFLLSIMLKDDEEEEHA